MPVQSFLRTLSYRPYRTHVAHTARILSDPQEIFARQPCAHKGPQVTSRAPSRYPLHFKVSVPRHSKVANSSQDFRTQARCQKVQDKVPKIFRRFKIPIEDFGRTYPRFSKGFQGQDSKVFKVPQDPPDLSSATSIGVQSLSNWLVLCTCVTCALVIGGLSSAIDLARCEKNQG